jgi:hypothetical protein
MCTYCGTTHYRKIYENHHGPIPKEENGRTYEIHHIDGDHSNNDPTNLIAVAIQEHYDIHYARGEFGACFKIAYRMKISPEELTELAKKHNGSRAEQGLLPMQIASKNGTHHWFELAKQGKHPGQISAKNGTAPFTLLAKNPEFKAARSKQVTGINNPTIRHRKICEYCNQEFGIGNYKKSHGENCKKNPANIGLPPRTNPTKPCECCHKDIGVNVHKKHQNACFNRQERTIV